MYSQLCSCFPVVCRHVRVSSSVHRSLGWASTSSSNQKVRGAAGGGEARIERKGMKFRVRKSEGGRGGGRDWESLTRMEGGRACDWPVSPGEGAMCRWCQGGGMSATSVFFKTNALRAGFSRPKRLADWLTTHRLHIHITETERERRRDDRVRQMDSEDR